MSLIVKQKVSYFDLIKRYVLNKISYVIFKLYERYNNNNVFSYKFKGDYLSPDALEDAESYVNEGDAIEFYKKVQSITNKKNTKNEKETSRLLNNILLTYYKSKIDYQFL